MRRSPTWGSRRRGRSTASALAASALLLLAGCASSATHAAVPTGTVPLAAFYGDSYTWGQAASSKAARWSSVLSATRGWTEDNFGVKGYGFVAHRTGAPHQVPDIIAAHPDVVIVMLGINDLLNWTSIDHAAVHTAVDDDFAALRSGLPDARIVIAEPMWAQATRPAALFELAGWEKSAAAAIHAQYLEGASLWLTQEPGLVSPDGLHPDDAGYAYIAHRVDAAMGSSKP